MNGLEFRPAITPSRWRAIVSAVLAAVILVAPLIAGGVLLLPRHLEYCITGGELRVVTGFTLHPRTRRWPLAAVGEARPVQLHGGRRLAGTALPGYCVGRFRYEETGTVWQATDCRGSGLLLPIEGQARPVLLSPPDSRAFRQALLGAGPYRHLFVFRGPRGAAWWGTRAFVALIAAVALWTAALLVLGARRLRYEVRPDALAVRTVFETHRFPLAGLHARQDQDIRLGMRLWGVGLLDYFAGLFRIPGAVARVYATTATGPFVILEGGRRPLVLSPADPEAFLEALRSFGVPTL